MERTLGVAGGPGPLQGPRQKSPSPGGFPYPVGTYQPEPHLAPWPKPAIPFPPLNVT